MWIFKVLLKNTIWGGDRIASYKNLSASDGVGESWELSGVDGSESVVAEGPDAGLTLSELVRRYKAALTGERNYRRFGDRFPLLIKFIDAKEDLSVQVHPDDTFARSHGYPNGKTEMWYVIGAKPGARIAFGFKDSVDSRDYERLVETGEIVDALNYVDIDPGQCYFIPAGRVHAIGAGAFVAEIQQTSEQTYRIYDYHRKDKEGNERELHTSLAYETIDFDDVMPCPVDYRIEEDVPVRLVECPYFTTNLLVADRELTRDYSEKDTFVVIIAVEGKADLTSGGNTLRIVRGTTVLIPASASGVKISPLGGKPFKMLETMC